MFTKVGIGTFVDPRHGGGRINARTTEELVRVQPIDGAEWLHYRSFPINIALLRGTTADDAGNVTMEREALTLDALAIATAAKNSGGFVIVQVERLAATGSLNPRQVVIPGALVDCVVVASPADHMQTYGTPYSPAFSCETRAPLGAPAPMPPDERKIIARRAAFELTLGGVVNLGIGMPEGVAAVAQEEGLAGYFTLTAEPGVIGGVPQGGLDFGAAVNADAIIDQNQQFDFYDGGGLDLACLGMAETDRARRGTNAWRSGRTWRAVHVGRLTYVCASRMFLHMRTTLIIDDALFRQLKRLAAEQNRSLSQVTQEMLQRGLSQARPAVRRKPVRLPVFSMGAPRVNVADRDQLYEVLDRS